MNKTPGRMGIAAVLSILALLIAGGIGSGAFQMQDFTPTVTVFLPAVLKAYPPTATSVPPTSTPIPPTATTAPAVCGCWADLYNCSDFPTHASAQACFDYCYNRGYGDVHHLDSDGDLIACESLP